MTAINVHMPLFSHYEMQITISFFKLTIYIFSYKSVSKHYVLMTV